MRTINEIKAEIKSNNLRSCGAEDYALWDEICSRADELRAELLAAIIADIPIDRLEEICAAERDGLLVFLPSKSEEIIRIVETALRLKLYDWQKAYITGASDYIMPGRVSGKTTAYMVKLCLSKGPQIDIWKETDRYLGEHHGSNYPGWFITHLREIHYELWRVGGLKLREISFDKPRQQRLEQPLSDEQKAARDAAEDAVDRLYELSGN